MLYKVIGPVVRNYLCDYVTLEDSGHRNGLVRKGETQSSVTDMGMLYCCANSNLLSQLSAMLSKWENKCISRTIQIYLLAEMQVGIGNELEASLQSIHHLCYSLWAQFTTNVYLLHLHPYSKKHGCLHLLSIHVIVQPPRERLNLLQVSERRKTNSWAQDSIY